MLMNDGRECAKQINAAEAAPTQEPTFQVRDAQVSLHAYIFGHYDSRGGATLLVGEPNAMTAMVKYNRLCCWPDLGSGAMEDLLNKEAAEIYWVGGVPDVESELDFKYEGEWAYARVQTRNRYKDNKEPGDWQEHNAWVFFKLPPGVADEEDFQEAWDHAHSKPECYERIASLLPGIFFRDDKHPWLNREIRLMPDSLGEDACGVIFSSTSPGIDTINTTVEW